MPFSQPDRLKKNEAEVLLGVLSQARAGDFGARMPQHWVGVAGKVADSLNVILASNQALGVELERVSRVVGREGRLSQRVSLNGADQVWAGCLMSVNSLIEDLVRPSNEMQRVIGAVADGDLSKKVSVDVQGEMLELKNTINAMVDQLNRFAGEVTRVAREVGVEGKLGGQAESEEVAGVWKDLTDNVNQLAANLTNQVRAIADVATAVTDGDLTRQVTVAAQGEVAVLKDKLNEMIRNLSETSRQNTEQDWLKTNLERFTRMLQGQRDLATVSQLILSELAPLVSAQHGVFYALTDLGDGGQPVLQFQAGYGFKERRHLGNFFRLGEGLVGQCALEKERILLTDVPPDYVRISSGLGQAPPLNIIVLPILFEGTVRAVVELASFSPFSAAHQSLLDQLTESIGLVLNTVAATQVTESLLEQAQSQAQELVSRQEQLHRSNAELADQAALLADKNSEVEAKYQEVEEAKRLVEEKATELSTSSRYKSEFIANMSHELRTPLNSLLVLAEQLQDNPEGNLTERQVQYAATIRSSGGDLLKLLNDILDLAKVESRTVNLELDDVSLPDLAESMLQTFQSAADKQGLAFSVTLDDRLPPSFSTDPHRLVQILKNLLSNAFKFTETGEIALRFDVADRGWSADNAELDRARSVIAVSVSDTGIGIKKSLHASMFEAFAQADGTTARRYGGTGLGLSISRTLAVLLGGEIALESEPGTGSTFTVYLPLQAADAASRVASQPALTSSISRVDITPPVPTNGHAAVALAPVQTRAAVATLPRPTPGPRTSGENAFYAGASAGATVMIVDDDFRNIFALTALLERGDLAVIAAGSGLEAIARLDQSDEIDVVLMDIMMPEMDGYETMAKIRELPEFADLPIIAVTAKVASSERDRCLAAGASDYIPKPVNTAELLAALSQWLPTAR